MSRRRGRAVAAAALALATLAGSAGCGSGGPRRTSGAIRGAHSRTRPATAVAATPSAAAPTAFDRRHNVYAADAPGHFNPVTNGDPALVYVPNSESNTVTEISQRTLKVVREFPTGALPQHVTPSHDLTTLWVDNDVGNTLTPIDPRTGRPGTPVPVADPYNLYFTPDGQYAIVVEERLQTLAFRDPTTMRLEHTLAVPMCRGVDHMDFSARGRYAYASCEFGGNMIEVDVSTLQVIGTLQLPGGNSSPQDVKLAPDGHLVYVADQLRGGVWEIDPVTFKVVGFLSTGAGAHGLYPSRNARDLYVSNRIAGSISVVSFATRHVVATWQLPLPASPDMGDVSADGKTLWLSGRYNAVVYAIDTRTGRLRAAIPVGLGPHGLCVWPQPGRYSLGHTGIMR